MGYFVDYSRLTIRQCASASDFRTEQAAQNALDEHVRLMTTYGIDFGQWRVISGGQYASFFEAKCALEEIAVAVWREAVAAAPGSERETSAFENVLLARAATNPNEPKPFEALGFGHRTLPAADSTCPEPLEMPEPAGAIQKKFPLPQTSAARLAEAA